MKFISLQENLKQGLFTVSHIAGKNINLPILNNVLLKAEKGNIKLIATNLEMGVVDTIRGKIENEGSFTVDSKIISDCVNLLPNKKINMELKDKNLVVDCENYKTKIKGQPAEEFPLIPEVDKEIFYGVRADEFKKALSQTIFSVSLNESRLELSGVLFVLNSGAKAGGLTMAATDSYRLAEKKLKIKTNSEEEKKIIIPAKTLQELIRILSGAKDFENTEKDDEIKFYVSENQILFTYGSTELVSRLIEGQYPDYEQIIPANAKTKIKIDRAEFARAVKVAAIFSKTGINDINLDFPASKNKVVISSVSGQTGENITELDAKINGSDNGMVINCRYLLDGLNNIDGEEIDIEITDNNTPCVLKPNKDENYLYIIMPIKQ